MHIHSKRWLLVFILLIAACFITTSYGARRGGGGGSRGGSRGGSSRTRYRPATSRPATFRPATYRPAPAPTAKPAPRPTQKPQPPSPKPPSASPKPSAPDDPVVVKQPASNPNYKETNPVQGSSDKQPPYNPNYKPDGNAPGGPPPPYSPAGQPAPNAPHGAPPPYSPGGHPPPYGSPGQNPPYPVQPGAQPPPYPGAPGRPPAYPGLPTHPGSAPYPVQPGSPGGNRPYPVQPGSAGGYPQQPGFRPVQPNYPGGYQQPGINRPYPVQPGFYQPGVNRPLGTNVWQPQSGRPAPPYMNYGGIPTGSNMYTTPHKKKGFLGSLMSGGGGKYDKKNKYLGNPYGVGGMGAAGVGHMAGKKSFLSRYGPALAIGSAAMFVILPFMAMRASSSLFMPRYSPMSMFSPMPHYHSGYYGHPMLPQHAHNYDIFNEEYFGRCQQPLKKENYAQLKCKSTYQDVKCGAKCEEGYTFPDNTTEQHNKCWHITGVWRPTKNYPECSPVCEEDCLNGGTCSRPGFCSCPSEYRGNRCQLRKLNFLKCDVRVLTKGEKVGWVCTHSKNETVCNIRCPEPRLFETPAANEYKCTPEGEWTPNSIPHCIAKDAEKKDSAA